MERTPAAVALVEGIAQADGVIIASPGYHAGISALVKNALDYVEDLRDADRPYLDGRAVGCITCAYAWPSAMSTLIALRSVVHALRGWPTPLGVAITTAELPFHVNGRPKHAKLAGQLEEIGQQVVSFGRNQRSGALEA